MNYVPMHYRDHADLKYVSYVWVDLKGAEFLVKTNIRTNSHTNTQLYILVQMIHK